MPQSLYVQVRDVSDALTCVLDNIGKYCGDGQRVTLMGHSAGAHLCAMALLHRAAAASSVHKAALPLKPKHDYALCPEQNASTDALDSRREADGSLCTSDGRMPSQCILAAGVYDLAKHYEFEEEVGSNH